MQTLKIEATPRADFGKKASRAIRREGQVPCVLYGGGETVSFFFFYYSSCLIYTD